MIEEEVRFNIVADTSEYEEGTKRASKSAKTLGDRVKGVSGKISAFGQKLAGIDVAVANVVLALKKVYNVSKDTSKMYNPVRFEKSTSKLDKAIRKMKTSLGAVLTPLYEGFNTVLGSLANWISQLAESFAYMMGYLQGFLGMLDSMKDSLDRSTDSLEEAGAEAEEGLASFDKLTTLSTSELGDMEQAERMDKLMMDSAKSGDRMRRSLSESLDISGRISNVTSSLTNTWDLIKTKGSEAWEHISNSFSTTIDKIKTKLSEIPGKIKSTFSEANEKIKETIQSIIDWFKRVFQNLYDESIGKIITGIQNAINKVMELIGKLDIAGSIKDTISDAGGSFQKWKEDNGLTWDQIKDSIPHFATGGVVAPNNPTMAVIGDNRNEPEVVAPQSMIENAMRNVMAESGGRPTEINISIDGRKIATATYDYIEQEYRRRGASW